MIVAIKLKPKVNVEVFSAPSLSEGVAIDYINKGTFLTIDKVQRNDNHIWCRLNAEYYTTCGWVLFDDDVYDVITCKVE